MMVRVDLKKETESSFRFRSTLSFHGCDCQPTSLSQEGKGRCKGTQQDLNPQARRLRIPNQSFPNARRDTAENRSSFQKDPKAANDIQHIALVHNSNVSKPSRRQESFQNSGRKEMQVTGRFPDVP